MNGVCEGRRTRRSMNPSENSALQKDFKTLHHQKKTIESRLRRLVDRLTPSSVEQHTQKHEALLKKSKELKRQISVRKKRLTSTEAYKKHKTVPVKQAKRLRHKIKAYIYTLKQRCKILNTLLK